MTLRFLLLLAVLIALSSVACGGDGPQRSEHTKTASRTPVPALSENPEGFEMTLERGACEGTCPVYSVTVRADGSVSYLGQQDVEDVGARNATIPLEEVERLVDKIEAIGYFSLEQEYACFAVDIPTYVSTVNLNGRSHRVSGCYGSGGRFSDTPAELHELEDLVDVVAGTARWIARDLNDFEITLERTQCFGTCPDYSLTVRGDGSVSYNGRMFVDVMGEQQGAASISGVRRLINEVERIDYFALAVETVESPEVCQAMDGPGYGTAVSFGGRTRTIARCPGIVTPETTMLAELEDLIDEVAGTRRWVGEP